MLDIRLFGMNPGAHHLTNLLFHIVNTLLLLYVLYRTTGQFWPSSLTAALFALPVAAHHNCAAGEVCPEEIGDAQDNHEEAINGIPDNMGTGDASNFQAMDPVDVAGEGTWDGEFPNQAAGGRN